VTVLFADLSGYTAVAERLDPESVKALLDGALQRLGEEVERYGGTVDKYIGDNVMAIFGAPVAHEDDAERAVRAALAMQAAMDEVNERYAAAHRTQLSLRVGVNTGEVLAGQIGAGYTVIGDAVNVASRLQTAAALGAVAVGERTVTATSGAVAYRELGALELKGKSEPVLAWEAVGLIGGPTPHARPEHDVAFVGRDGELGLLASVFERVAVDRRPQLVTLVGEAGVGKSRLLRELQRKLVNGDQAPLLRTGRCPPYGSRIGFWPLTEILRTECEIHDEDPAALAWKKFADRLGELLAVQFPAEEDAGGRRVALVGRVLGLEVPGEVGIEELDDPQRAREAFFSAIRGCVDGMARQAPLVLAFEDIHWADDGLLDLIEHLARSVRAPVLIVCLAREELLERRPKWGGARRSMTTMLLEPLDERRTSELVDVLLAGQDLREEVVAAIASRSAGNPFFAEELVQRLAEAGDLAAPELPDTVQGLLTARLDSLEPLERRVVQHAAVLGRSFPEVSLLSVDADGEPALRDAIDALQEKGIFVAGEADAGPGSAELAFKHVLIRDAAYSMLPKAVRARKHFEVAHQIEARAGERTDEVVPLLAEHYGRAARLGEQVPLEPAEYEPMRARALLFLEAAGDAAAALYSNAQALMHYQAAQELANQGAVEARMGSKLGDVALRLGRVDAALEAWKRSVEYHAGIGELEAVADLHRRIGAALAHKGDRKSAIEHHQLGINLIKEQAPTLTLVRLYEDAALLYMNTGDNMLAIYAAEKALRLAEELGEARAASRAHGIFGRVFGRVGDRERARESLERAVELARASTELETILALIALGDHREISDADYAGAEASYREALTIAQRIGDVPAEIELHADLAQLAVYRPDWEAVRASSDASAELAEREGLVGKLSLSIALRGVLCWREANWTDAERHYRRALELAERVGWSEVACSALIGLAITLRDRGDLDAAAAELERAVELCDRAGLTAQLTQVTALRAVVLALAGRAADARQASQSATELAERLRYPVAEAAALEASAAVTDGADGGELAHRARDAWRAIGRPLEAARCELLAGRLLEGSDIATAVSAFEAAGREFNLLGVSHLAQAAGARAAQLSQGAPAEATRQPG